MMDETVRKIIGNGKKINKTLQRYQTPTYLFDKFALKESIEDFRTEFLKHIPNSFAFYAIKSNHYQPLLKVVAKEKQFGLDASSKKELILALQTSSNKILFTGPAKTEEELKLAIENDKRVIIQIDSFRELKLLNALTKKNKKKVRAGVRIHTRFHGTWTKFGIDIKDLARFWKDASSYPFIDIQGIQSHTSFNTGTKKYLSIVKEISLYLKSPGFRPFIKSVKFIDLGGGFLTYKAEGDYLRKSINDIPKSFKYEKGIPLSDYAKPIGKAISKYLRPSLQCDIFFEPGRIISQKSMHILLEIADIKSNKVVILDGGNNIIGWEKYEETYVPSVNITRPSEQKLKNIILYGNLCTPSDIWGYFCFSKKMSVGDRILLPYQGAYTYTYRQEFIKGLPKAYDLHKKLF